MLTQKAELIAPFSAEVRKLYVTKLLRRPIQKMIYIVEGQANQEQDQYSFLKHDYGYSIPSAQYLLYSGHDTNLALVL